MTRDFSVLRPGETFRMTADERIIEVVPKSADSAELRVEFSKGSRNIKTDAKDRDRRVTELLRENGLPLNVRCGERGKCDGCRVEICGGALVGLNANTAVRSGFVRACEHCLGESGVTLRIPARSELAYQPQIVSEFRVNVPAAREPLWQSIEVAKGASVLETVRRSVNDGQPVRLVDGIAAQAPERVFAHVEFRGDHWRVIGLATEEPKRVVGAAVDIGTTTVALQLVDLRSGEVVASASGFNRQMDLGDDVATRIGLCTDSAMVQKLQSAIYEQTIRPLLAEANRDSESVVCMAIAGNTTMLHLFAGEDPLPMGVYPFKPAFLGHRMFGSPVTHLLPGAAAYIGADLVAGILATGMAYDDGPSLLVDVGTNGEIILKHNGKLFGCATAAGPAFEGAGLSSGMRAGAGAVEQIEFSPSPAMAKIRVIGNLPATGICGSAYLDFLASARRIGWITETGRFNKKSPAEAEELLMESGDGKTCLRVARASDGSDIVVSESDIAHLMQAKAAIAAGILTLLDRSGLSQSDIKQLYLAGGFGMHLNVVNAIACGLLPGFAPEQVQVVGNTSLAGAYLALLDAGAIEEMTRISREMEVVELNLDPEFESRYVDQLSL